MAYVLIPIVSLLVAGLTFFSGFGVGTLLLPAFALFFPVESAVAMTAIVHFLNNVFKLALVGRWADLGVVARFGLPAIVAALGGAGMLVLLSKQPPLATYQLGQWEFDVMPVKFVVALVMLAFALIEILPKGKRLQFKSRHLPIGGVISGFFGGLSGHQGAMRSAFLIRSGLSKEAFIATGVVIACLVDVARLSVYATHWWAAGFGNNTTLLILATLTAFVGTFLGNRLLRKTTLKTVRLVVSVMLVMVAIALAAGWI